MLPLAGANFVSVVLFVTVYAAGGARWLSQRAFVACLVLMFGLVVALWLAVEARTGRSRDPLSRLGRAAAGLVLVVLAAPVAALMPLFWLDSQLPPEAGMGSVIAPTMTLVLVALLFTVLANVLALVIAAARLVLRAPRR